MVKIINSASWGVGYSEISQKNPMQWQNVKPVDKDIYEPVSNWWVCKDFMNDVVTAYHSGKVYSIYGFKCDPKTFFAPDQKDLYILVRKLTECWEENMKTVNEYLLSQGFPEVTWKPVKENQVLLTLDSLYMHNTMFISQVTLFIRMANINKVYSTMEELGDDPQNDRDKNNFRGCIQKPLGQFPLELDDYIWYYNEKDSYKHGEKDKGIVIGLMHNCGVVSWGWRE